LNANRIFIAAAGIIVIAFYFLFDLQAYMTLASLKSNFRILQNYYTANKLPFLAGFMAVYFFQTALSLPGSAIMSLAAGAIFGTSTGLLCVIIAATFGAVAAFLATRHLFQDYVTCKFGSRMDGINRKLEVRSFNYLLFLRLVPLFPFFLINLAAGLTCMPLRTFFWGTFLGIIPGGFLYVNAGTSLSAIDSMSDIVSPSVSGSLALLGIFVLLPIFFVSSSKESLK
jgi:uncharacterized membrane protein YdjX (TVP38/TMEM64 family)